jgi:hypothetical protein
MPQNIIAIPTTGLDVLPRMMLLALNEQLRVESLVNQDYVDGSSDRLPLASVSRSFFRLNVKLTSAAWSAFRTFYAAHQGVPFFFYFPREAQPPYTVDMTGASVAGRYTVVFDGQMSETYYPGNAQTGNETGWGNYPNNPSRASVQIQFALREVE